MSMSKPRAYCILLCKMAKEHIRTPNELLRALAEQGEPAAFYALFSADIRATFRSTLEVHSDPGQVVKLLLAFYRRLYREFTASPPRITLEEWHEKQVRHHLPKQTTGQSDEISLESLADDRFGEFESVLQRMLEREYGKVRNRTAHYSPFRRAATVLWEKPPLRRFVYALGSLMLTVAMAQAFFSFTNTTLTVRLVSGDRQLKAALPIRLKERGSAGSLAIPEEKTKQHTPSEASAQDSSESETMDPDTEAAQITTSRRARRARVSTSTSTRRAARRPRPKASSSVASTRATTTRAAVAPRPEKATSAPTVQGSAGRAVAPRAGGAETTTPPSSTTTSILPERKSSASPQSSDSPPGESSSNVTPRD